MSRIFVKSAHAAWAGNRVAARSGCWAGQLRVMGQVRRLVIGYLMRMDMAQTMSD
jgi:hypothetical protein